jgi:D-galactarolactone cycloisomerase
VRIERVAVYFLRAPVRQAFSASAVRGRHTHRTAILVRLDTDEGLSGWGETFPALASPPGPILEVLRGVLAPAVLGADPLLIREVNTRLRQAVRGMGTGVWRALSALDVALWDLRGRALRQPVCQLLGVRPGGQFPAVATAVFYGPEPSDLAPRLEVTALYRERGFCGIKIKVGGLSPAADLHHAEGIRSQLPSDVMLCADANSGYALRTAPRAGRPGGLLV